MGGRDLTSLFGVSVVGTGKAVAGAIAYTKKQLSAYRTATDARVAAIELSTRQIDALAFRLTAASTNAPISRGLADLQAAVSQQSGDIRVVREMLHRIERQTTSASYTPLSASE